jgi:hypothetical protein
MVVMALIVIPYFHINIQAEGVWLRDKTRKLRNLGIVIGAATLLLVFFQVWAILIPTWLITGLMVLAAASEPSSPSRFRRWLVSKPLSFWIMTWFLVQASVLTVIGTFFRGAGWAWVWPWRT